MQIKSLDLRATSKWIGIWTALLLPGLLGQPTSSFCMCMVARKVPMMLSACLRKLFFRKAPTSNQQCSTTPPSRPQVANTFKPTTPAAATTMGRKRRLSDQGGRATPPPRYAIATNKHHHHHHTPAEIISSAKMEHKLPNRPRPRRKHRQRQGLPRSARFWLDTDGLFIQVPQCR